jgi:hypothetical protein
MNFRFWLIVDGVNGHQIVARRTKQLVDFRMPECATKVLVRDAINAWREGAIEENQVARCVPSDFK